MGRLDGKVALITGTGGGQGRAAAQIFAREGAKVVGCDLKIDGNRETAQLVADEDGTMINLEPIDLTSVDDARRFVDTALEAFGGIDILYNNASAQRFGPVADITPEDWRFTMNNDLEIVFPVTQYAWGHLIERGGGSIIITSSGSGLLANRNFPTLAHSTAKAGVIGFARACRRGPGTQHTGQQHRARPDRDARDQRTRFPRSPGGHGRRRSHRQNRHAGRSGQLRPVPCI